MMNPDQSAFPSSRDTQAWGLTKREFIAAMMLQALVGKNLGVGNPNATEQKLAERATRIADALIAELAESQDNS